MFPTVVVNGLFKREILIGDPFYTSRIKIAAKNPFDLESGYVADPAATGNREIISLGETAIGFLMKMLKLGISETYIYSTIMMGSLALFLFLKILNNRSQKTTFFLCSAGLFIFWGPHNDYSFERPISPQISIIVYLAIVLGIKKCLTSKNSKFKLLIGIQVGLSAYLSSPFTFIAASIAFFTYLILILIDKKINKTDYASAVAYAIFVTPYIYSNIANSKDKSFNDLILRQGLIESHLPAARVTVIMLMLVFSYIIIFSNFTKIKTFDKQNLFLNFLILQIFMLAIVSNSNLFTGKALQFSNHFDHFSKIILILVIGSTLDSLKSDNLKLVKIVNNLKSSQLIAITLTITLVATMAAKCLSVKEIEKPTLKEQHIWSFIHKNIENNQVVFFSDMGMAASAEALIDNKLFFSPDIFNYNFTQKEINLRYFSTTACTAKTIDKSSWGFTYGLRGLEKIGKINRYIIYVKKLNLDGLFLKSLLSQQANEISNFSNLVTDSEKNSRELSEVGCLDFIESRDVNYLIVENSDSWKFLASTPRVSLVKVVDSSLVYKIN